MQSNEYFTESFMTRLVYSSKLNTQDLLGHTRDPVLTMRCTLPEQPQWN